MIVYATHYFGPPLDDYRLSVKFDDGAQGVVCLSDRLFGPIFEPLRDPAAFRQVFVDEFGAIAWPNGFPQPLCN